MLPPEVVEADSSARVKKGLDPLLKESCTRSY